MKVYKAGLFAAAASVVLFVPEIALSQTAQTSQPTSHTMSAGTEASEMVPAQAVLDRSIDANKVKPGEEITARLANKVHLKNGTELPSGTELIGKIGTDDMQQNGTSKLALCLDQAKLKNGNIIPLKATIVGIYGSGAGAPEPYPEVPGDQVANDWTRSTHQVDQIDALSGVDMHSSLVSRNSGVLVTTRRDDIKLREGTELALAIGPLKAGQQSSKMQ